MPVKLTETERDLIVSALRAAEYAYRQMAQDSRAGVVAVADDLLERKAAIARDLASELEGAEEISYTL
jgi:uncharacterized membrane protein